MVLFVLGTLVGILSPVFRRDTRLRAVILASGAAILSVVAAGYLLHQDPRDGLATIRANQQLAGSCWRPACKALLARVGNSRCFLSLDHCRLDLAEVFLALVMSQATSTGG